MSTDQNEALTFDEPIPEDPVPVVPPVDPEAEPEPEPDPTPPPPVGDTIVWEPATWYSITYACRTAGCPNENVVHGAPMFYSNDGQTQNIRVVDSVCNKDSMIVTATKLNPQPVEE